MSEVIVRSLATSFCTILPVIALFLFGGETLKDFAFALIVGTLSGTYSSVFIASPLLVHWKEREPVHRARVRRIREALGYVPAYAVATAGAPVDVEPDERRRGPVPALTAPQDPTQVSRSEFDDMVRNLGIEEAEAQRTQPAAAAAGRPAGGRRARSRANGGKGPGASGQGGKGSPPAAGDGGGGSGKPKKSRNRRHGRPR
jgi:SecD/SecF fusion protein